MSRVDQHDRSVARRADPPVLVDGDEDGGGPALGAEPVLAAQHEDVGKQLGVHARTMTRGSDTIRQDTAATPR